MRQLATDGAPEGLWLRAERQTGGRGRSGRMWISPPGNLHASTLVRLRDTDPPAPTLALVAGVALYQAVQPFFRHPGENRDPGTPDHPEIIAAFDPDLRGADRLQLKWPNDLLVGARKLAGILLERVEAAVVIGIGVNLAHHPEDQVRPATSLAAEGLLGPPADAFLTDLARGFEVTLSSWRERGLANIRAAWLDAAHPLGTSLVTHGPDGETLTGTFDGLDPDGACRLRLADGAVRLIHAGDVFLV